MRDYKDIGKEYKLVGEEFTVGTLFTKRDLIEVWKASKNIDIPCCPFCRDNLHEDDSDNLFCENAYCINKYRYEKIKE